MMNRKQEYLEDLDAALDRTCYEWVLASEGEITWPDAVKVMRDLADALEKEMAAGRVPWELWSFEDGQPDEAQEWHDFDPEA
jgi:hypothetical protein